MVKDTKMTEKATEETPKDDTDEETPAPIMPPLEAAAHRLERLLGGGRLDKDSMLHSYTNPAKVVRRWLGTSSGASTDAAVEDISAAAAALLDPDGPCARGRELLCAGGAAMEVDAEKTGAFLTKASAREVESWLISLAVRLLYKEKNYQKAFDLSQKAIDIIMARLEEAALHITSVSATSTSSLFPLLARMLRWRSLVAESLANPALSASLRVDMAKAHNMASLRRDVDSQATLLNCMLRDLLLNKQGTYDWRRVLIVPLASLHSPVAHLDSLSIHQPSGASTQAPFKLDLSGFRVQ
jgi:hypothetical protein